MESEEKVEKEEKKEKSSQESLSDLLFKLEFTHLGDNHSFSHLTSNEKEHFSQLLETVITKLKPKNLNNQPNKIKPIAFDTPSTGVESPRTSPEALSPKQQINYEKLEHLVMMR